LAFKLFPSRNKQPKDVVFDPFGDVNARWYSLKNNEDYAKAYYEVPEANAIINNKSKQFAKGIWRCRDIETEELIEDDKFLKVLHKPNPLMSGSEFNEAVYRDKEIFGNAYKFFLTPLASAPNPDNVEAIYNLNARYTYPKGTGKLYYQTELDQIIEKYIFELKGQSYDFSPETVCHISRGTIEFENGLYLLGDSPLKPLDWALSNIRAAYEARNVYITKRGAFGILTNNAKGDFGVTPLDSEDKAEVQKGLNRYGLSKKQWQFIVTNASLKWEAISISSKDLELYKEVKESTIAIANEYGYPTNLLGLDDTTFENQRISERRLYEDSILPDAKQISGELNRSINAAEYGKEYFLDYSHVAALQSDKKTEAERHDIAVGTVIELNTAIQAGNISYESAVATLVKVTGIQETEAENLLSPKTKKDETD
jgi:phage portal protein BeeE